MACDAVALFVVRARAAGYDVALHDPDEIRAVVEICRRLDALPLAIELAAARCRSLGVAEILDALGDAVPLLTRGARTTQARQATLDASIAWSYDLLDADQQLAMRRLAVFRGGCSLAAARAVLVDTSWAPVRVLDVLDELVASSLLAVEHGDGRVRYGLLETVREFAGRRLDEAGERAVAAGAARRVLHAVDQPPRRGDRRTGHGGDRQRARRRS